MLHSDRHINMWIWRMAHGAIHYTYFMACVLQVYVLCIKYKYITWIVGIFTTHTRHSPPGIYNHYNTICY